jgi:predicted HicB family RNase H-like nuclease
MEHVTHTEGSMATEDETKRKFIQAQVSPHLHKAVHDAAKQDRRSVTNWVNVQLERATQKQTERQASDN